MASSRRDACADSGAGRSAGVKTSIGIPFGTMGSARFHALPAYRAAGGETATA